MATAIKPDYVILYTWIWEVGFWDSVGRWVRDPQSTGYTTRASAEQRLADLKANPPDLTENDFCGFCGAQDNWLETGLCEPCGRAQYGA